MNQASLSRAEQARWFLRFFEKKLIFFCFGSCPGPGTCPACFRAQPDSKNRYQLFRLCKAIEIVRKLFTYVVATPLYKCDHSQQMGCHIAPPAGSAGQCLTILIPYFGTHWRRPTCPKIMSTILWFLGGGTTCVCFITQNHTFLVGFWWVQYEAN